jgi:hypothetical protein
MVIPARFNNSSNIPQSYHVVAVERGRVALRGLTDSAGDFPSGRNEIVAQQRMCVPHDDWPGTCVRRHMSLCAMHMCHGHGRRRRGGLCSVGVPDVPAFGAEEEVEDELDPVGLAKTKVSKRFCGSWLYQGDIACVLDTYGPSTVVLLKK